MGEQFDVLDDQGQHTGHKKCRKQVHADGDWHRAVHVWLYAMATKRVLIQKRCEFKDSFPGLWDISAAGHVSAGDGSLSSAVRETFEELGVRFPKDAFEFLFTCKLASISQGGAFVNNEFNDVYLVTVKDEIPVDAFVLDEAEVDDVKYVAIDTLAAMYRAGDKSLVPADLDGEYGRLFKILDSRGAAQSLPGSGLWTFFHEKRGRRPEQVQCLTFDETYVKLVPPEAR